MTRECLTKPIAGWHERTSAAECRLRMSTWCPDGAADAAWLPHADGSPTPIGRPETAYLLRPSHHQFAAVRLVARTWAWMALASASSGPARTCQARTLRRRGVPP
jgi:hypothetical protein